MSIVSNPNSNDSGRFFGISNPSHPSHQPASSVGNSAVNSSKPGNDPTVSEQMLAGFAGGMAGLGQVDVGHIGASLQPPSLGSPAQPINPSEAAPSESGDKSTEAESKEAGGFNIAIGGKDPGIREIKPGILVSTEFE